MEETCRPTYHISSCNQRWRLTVDQASVHTLKEYLGCCLKIGPPKSCDWSSCLPWKLKYWGEIWVCSAYSCNFETNPHQPSKNRNKSGSISPNKLTHQTVYFLHGSHRPSSTQGGSGTKTLEQLQVHHLPLTTILAGLLQGWEITLDPHIKKMCSISF